MAMREPILVLNAGSSSIKFSVYQTRMDRTLAAGAHGQVEGIGANPRLEVADPVGRPLAAGLVPGGDHVAAINAIQGWFQAHLSGDSPFAGVGHRVVHGGG
jgi:acetate kinase